METEPATELSPQSCESLQEQSSIPPRDLLPHLGLCLLAGLIFDLFFRNYLPGVSIPLYAILILGVMAWSFRERVRFGANFESFLPIAILLLSATFLFFTNTVLQSINQILLPILFLLLMVLWAKGTSHAWSDLRVANDLFSTLKQTPASSVKPVVALVKTAPMNPEIRDRTFKIAMGLLFSLPLLLLILLLLNSADQLFSNYIKQFFELISFDLPEIISHALFILIPALGLSGLLWALRTRPALEPSGDEIVATATWDALIFSTVLVSVNLLYLLFCWIQFSYLFAGAQGTLPSGFSYAEYARRGFLELSLVTLLNIGIVSCGVYCVEQRNATANKFARLMLSLLVLQSLVILASSFTRLSLYESFYGYTYARLFARTMIVIMGIILALLFARTWRHNFPFWKSTLLALLISYIGLNYFNVDRFIAVKNVERYHKTSNLDFQYLSSLSHEAVPVMIELAAGKNPELAQFFNRELLQRKSNLEEHQAFPEFNLSRHNALKMLSSRR